MMWRLSEGVFIHRFVLGTITWKLQNTTSINFVFTGSDNPLICLSCHAWAMAWQKYRSLFLLKELTADPALGNLYMFAIQETLRHFCARIKASQTNGMSS